jgi:hypothetical protein
MRSRALLLVGMALLGCGDDEPKGIIELDALSPGPVYETVAEVPATVNRNLDVLLVVDDTMVDQPANLAANLPSLLDVLASFPGGFPDVHIGVVTTDLGTRGSDGTIGPAIGSVNNGGCSGTGKNGNLQTMGADVQGTFVIDVQNTGGTRHRNYTGALATVLGQMVQVGSGGCAFEQPLAAMRAALDDNPANTGFLRADARLLVAIFADEDDCSFTTPELVRSDATGLGELQSFRCTQFGVTCSIGGATPDAMAMPGVKNGCHANPQSPYVDDVTPYAELLAGLKADPKDVMVATFAGTAAPFEVESRAAPGTTTPFPALAPSCSYTAQAVTVGAVPPARLLDFTRRFPDRAVNESLCQQDLSAGLVDVGRLVNRVAGSPCIALDARLDVDTAAPGVQADCVAEDVDGDTVTSLPACDASLTPDCWHLVDDPLACPRAGERRLGVERTAAPAPSTVTRLRCRVP